MLEVSAPTLHVGVIMDGNGRWAEARGLTRVAGHARGARRVTEIVKACPDLGVTHLTLYAFSTENWRRPLEEVEGLMRIFRQYIVAKMEGLRRNDVRVRFVGMRHRVPARLRELMEALEAHTRGVPRAEPDDRDRLRRARRADPGGARPVAAGRVGRARAGGDLRGGARGGARHPRAAGPGLHHPHLGRAPDLELPALAGGLCRVRLPGGGLARLRRSRTWRPPWIDTGCASGASARPSAAGRPALVLRPTRSRIIATRFGGEFRSRDRSRSVHN